MNADKKAINEERAKFIAEKISTPEGRIILEANMWNPLPRDNEVRKSDETELEWAERVMKQFRDRINSEEITK